MEISIDIGGALVLTGELDAVAAPLAAAALAAEDVDVVDLAGVGFIDSAGLRVLVHAHQARLESGSSLTLRRPTDGARRLFELSGLRQHLVIDP